MAKTGRLFAKVLIAAAGNTSDEFNIPENLDSATFHVPALTTAGGLRLQAKKPVETENETPVWTDVAAFDLTAGVQAGIALDAIGGAAAVAMVIPGSAMGGGVFRLRTAADAAEAAERDIRIEFKEN